MCVCWFAGSYLLYISFIPMDWPKVDDHMAAIGVSSAACPVGWEPGDRTPMTSF